ncbi:hypothetical protein Tco_1115105, partial [Tanacetum coccineum]
PPKKSRGKGSQKKKTADTPVADVDVFEESDSEPTRKRTASRRVVKKKVTISAADNIIPDLDVTLELGKAISLTEVAEEEAARQVHATHARIVIESILEPARRRPSGIAFRDTSQVSKKVFSNPSQKLKGVQSLTHEEQEAADTMKALKESKKTSRRHPGTRGSSEGTGSIPGVPNESTIVSATSSEGIGTIPGVPDEEKVTSEENIDSDEDEEKKNDIDDYRSIDLEMTDDEETNDEFVHGDEQVKDDENEEMLNAEVEDSGNGFGDQFLKLSSATSLVSTVKDTTDVEINSLLDIKIQSEVPHIQSPSFLTVPVLVISEPSVLTPIPKTPSVAPAITLLTPSSVSTIPPDVSELKKIDHSTEALATLKSRVLMVVEHYLGSKIGDDLQKIASEIRKIKKELGEKQKMPKYTIKSTNKAALKEYDHKSALYQTDIKELAYI